MHTNGKTILRGLLIAEGWDRQGNATMFALFTLDEGKYLLEPGEDFAVFRENLRKPITVAGTVRTENKHNILVVESVWL